MDADGRIELPLAGSKPVAFPLGYSAICAGLSRLPGIS